MRANSPRLIHSIVAALIACMMLPSISTAQGIYKQITPDGKVLYTDKPVVGAKTEKTLDSVAPPPRASMRAVTPILNVGTPGTPIGRMPSLPPLPDIHNSPSDSKSPSAPASTAPTQIKQEALIASASELLAQARNLQTQGMQPGPGDRTPNANGSTRLNENYNTRQRDLTQKVQEAQTNLANARK